MKQKLLLALSAFFAWMFAAPAWATVDFTATTVEIGSAEELVEFEKYVNGGKTMAGQTVTLTADINLTGIAWTPIGNVNDYPGKSFAGTFDGNSKTISNLTCVDNTANYACAGFFGSLTGAAVVKDLTLANVNIQSTHYAGGVCAYIGGTNTVSITNCKVDGGTIKSTPELIDGAYDNGDKVGGIIGYTVAGVTVSACAVEDATISAYRDLGGIAGYAAGTVEQCSVSNCTIIQDNTNAYMDESYVPQYAEIVGNGTPTTTNNTATNVEKKNVSGNVAKISDVEYKTLAEAVTAAKTGDVVVIIASDTYTIPNLPNYITIKADEDVEVVFNCVGSGSIASVPNGATFENVTMNFGQAAYHGFQHAGTINMNGCTLNGLFFSYGDMNFNKCTFNQDQYEYMMWDYGNDLTYTNCVFYGKGKFINVYNEGNGNWKLTVTGCTFNNDGDAKKAPLNIKETCKSTLLGWDVTIGKGNTLVGNFPANSTSETLIVGGDGLWQVDDRCSDHTQSLVVVADDEGTVLYEAEKKPAPAEEIKIAEELAITPAEGGSELDETQKAAATEAIETLASNTEATTLPEDTKETNTAAVNEDILTEGQSVIVDVVIKSATVDATTEGGIVIKQVTFDVTPYVAENGKATDTEIENKDIEKPITFRLPVAASVTDTKAAVYHEGEPLGIKNIATGTDGSKYIEISSTEFSEFSYALMSTMPTPQSIEYYAGSSTKQTGTIKDFETAAATNPNAIAIVSSEYEDLAALYTN